jgi:hypothetical protein
MKIIPSLMRWGTALVIALVSLLTSGCLRFSQLTYKNEIASPPKVVEYMVPLNYADIPKRTWNDAGDLVNAGSSLTLSTDISAKRSNGINYKYVVIAVTEAKGTVFSKFYTWDELNDAKWTVIITAP